MNTTEKPKFIMFPPGMAVTPELLEAVEKLIGSKIPVPPKQDVDQMRKAIKQLGATWALPPEANKTRPKYSLADIEVPTEPIYAPSAEPIMIVDSLDGETEATSAMSNAERVFLDYSYAGSKVAKVIRSAVILRAEPGESWESENFGAIVEMTDGRILPLITDKYDGFDDWDRSAAEAQLAMVEKNAAELRAMLASWPSKPVTIHEGKTSVQTFADQSYRVRSSTQLTSKNLSEAIGAAKEAGDE